MRILIIDDDQDDQALFCEAVGAIDNEICCETADDGIAGLRLLLTNVEQAPDIIFLDVNMPMMDGRETLKAIRKHPKLAQLPVIIYSTSSSEVDQLWFRQMDVKYLVKPNDFKSIVSMLSREMHNIKTANLLCASA
ncbi:MAG TPA: response regulator [Chryseosolibacter sp.]